MDISEKYLALILNQMLCDSLYNAGQLTKDDYLRIVKSHTETSEILATQIASKGESV